jgi:glycosyltransferase involved in cell wall biosynthesis
LTDLPPIYLLTGEFPPRIGGIADYTARLAESLQDLGLDVVVLIGRDHPLARDGSVPAERLASSVAGWGLLPAVAQRIGTESCVVHIQYQTGAFGMHPAINVLPSWLRWRRPGARTIVTCHDVRLPYLFPKAGRLRDLVMHWMIDHSSAATFSNEADRRWAGGQPTHTLIPIGSGVPVVPGSDDSAHGAGESFRLGYFGFMNATKGVRTLLEAVAGLVADERNIRLVFIGDALGDADATNSRTRARLEDDIVGLGLADYIERTGALPLHDVSAELQRCHALVFPFDDGASFRRSSLTAALVHARPTITTLLPNGENGIPGFESGESVLLVPPGNVAALTRAIATLMDDDELRSRLSAGAAVVSERLQWPRIAESVRQVYASVTPTRSTEAVR